jgi:uncharacterized protein (TIGR02145 family)
MKKVSLILSSVLIIAMMLTSFRGSVSKEEVASKQVTIGKQVWMTENLNVDKFRNGDPIPEAKTDEEWEKAGINGQPVWCYYNNDRTNGVEYGKLYNWYAVNDPRGLAPEGLHVPSDEEWTTLDDFLGEGDVSTKMKSTSGWTDNEGESGNGTNESGFSGLPGGGRYSDGTFSLIGMNGVWWSSSEDAVPGDAWYRVLGYNHINLFRNSYSKADGWSVRCIMD